MSSLGFRPSWVSDRLFPFESKFVEVDGNIIHYIDEGSGPTLLMLHGNPAWSFLYRHAIAGLRNEFRCIALDLPGFGLSFAHAAFSFSPAEHARVVKGFCDRLALEGVTLVMNDWGGPIGFWVAQQRPETFSRFVIANTWAWPVNRDWHFEWFSRAVGGPLGHFLIRRFNLFVNLLVPAGHTQTKLTPEEMRHYRFALPTPARRTATAVLPREILRSAPWLAGVDAGLGMLKQAPTLILWGAKDFAFRAKERTRFESLFPHHRTVILAAAGHFVADDAPAEFVAEVRRWMHDTAAQ